MLETLINNMKSSYLQDSFLHMFELHYVTINNKGNICSQIEFLCVFSPLCTFYFFGSLGLGVALIRIIANTL